MCVPTSPRMKPSNSGSINDVDRRLFRSAPRPSLSDNAGAKPILPSTHQRISGAIGQRDQVAAGRLAGAANRPCMRWIKRSASAVTFLVPLERPWTGFRTRDQICQVDSQHIAQDQDEA